jgi:hypothetical protein
VLSTQSCLTGEAVTAGKTGTSVSLDVLMSEVNKTSNHVIPVLRTGLYGSSISYTGTRDLFHRRGLQYLRRAVHARSRAHPALVLRSDEGLLDRLSAIPDGTGTLFDHTTLLHTSEFGGPNSNSAAGQHSNRNLPYMTAAGSQTPFKGGQSLKVTRSHGDYLLTLAKGFGSMATTMGVGTSTIDGILK